MAQANSQGTLEAATAFDPVVAVIDVGPDGAELETVRLLAKLQPGIPILCLLPDAVAPLPDTRWIRKTECTAEAFLDAIHAAAVPDRQGTPVPDLTRAKPVLGGLSQRERQVLGLLMRGLTMKEVGRILNIAPRTVAFHKYRIMEKNDLRTNSDLISFAITNGIGRA